MRLLGSHNLTDVTREVLKDSDVKKLVTMNLLPEDVRIPAVTMSRSC